MRNPTLHFSVSCFRNSRVAWMLLVVFLTSFVPSVSFAQQPTAAISSLKGTVLVNGQEKGQGTVLMAGDVIETQAGASVVLELSDGSTLDIGESTKLDLAVLMTTDTGGRVSKVKLWWGKVRAKLSPGHQQADAKFDIETPNAVVGVKFSQPEVEVSYSLEKAETVALALTVALMVKNLLTNEETVVPVGAMVIITALAIKIAAGAAVSAAVAETAGATAGGISTKTIALGALGLGGAGAALAMAAGGSDESGGPFQGTWYQPYDSNSMWERTLALKQKGNSISGSFNYYDTYETSDNAKTCRYTKTGNVSGDVVEESQAELYLDGSYTDSCNPDDSPGGFYATLFCRLYPEGDRLYCFDDYVYDYYYLYKQ